MRSEVQYILYAIPFMVEIFIGTLLFTKRFQKKNNYGWKLLIAIFFEIILTVLAGRVRWEFGESTLASMLFYIVLFMISTIYLFLCYEETIPSLIECGMSGYLCQHILSQVEQFCFALSGEKNEILYAKDWVSLLHKGGVWFFVREAVFICLIYGVLNKLFVQKIIRYNYEKKMNRQILVLSMVSIMVVVVLSSVRDNYASESFVLMAVSRCFSLFICFLILTLKTGMIEINNMKQEQEFLNDLHAMELRQYESQKENIELINIKCHDLRHRLDDLEKLGQQISPEEIRETRDLIRVYDMSLKTGNDSLDMIIAQKSMVCQDAGIRISCIADGEKLSFMKASDIYYFFDNALSNAIEAVSKLEDENDRIISISVRAVNSMLIITVENSFNQEIREENGRLQTTKDDRVNHGFGLKSMERIANKYKGSLVIKKDDIFSVSMLLPMPK